MSSSGKYIIARFFVYGDPKNGECVNSCHAGTRKEYRTVNTYPGDPLHADVFEPREDGRVMYFWRRIALPAEGDGAAYAATDMVLKDEDAEVYGYRENQ